MLPVVVIFALAAGLTQVTPAPIVAAERAFAADGAVMGVKRSFLKHSTPDAIVFAPDPVNAHQSLAAEPDLKPGEDEGLVWWPLWAGIARSGDLGFTTGPVEVKGQRRSHYFTIWKRQADGAWKWIYDGGGGGDARAEAAQGSSASYLPLASAHAASPAAAVREVASAEAAVAARARTDQKAALLAVLADDGRVHAPREPPAKDRAAFERVLATRPAAIDYAPLRAESSRGGDLVWTYGSAKWVRDGQPGAGYYVRVWQDRRGGWKLVYDQISAKPPPAAKPELSRCCAGRRRCR